MNAPPLSSEVSPVVPSVVELPAGVVAPSVLDPPPVVVVALLESPEPSSPPPSPEGIR